MSETECGSVLVLGPEMKVRCQRGGADHDTHWLQMRLPEFPSGRFVATRIEWTT